VSLWGESAGGGSVAHHLIAYGGKDPALFKRAAVMSPAIAPAFDRNGELEKGFQIFAQGAGCGGDDAVACLRKLNWKDLKAAQDKYIKIASPGGWGFGPVVDGSLIRQAPILEFAQGNHVKNIESLLITHVRDEGDMFNMNVPDDTAFSKVIDEAFGSTPSATAAVLAQYPLSKYANPKLRFGAYMSSAVFSCYTRVITEAYQGRTWNLQFNHGTGQHGTDLTAMFPGEGYFTALSLMYGSSNKGPKTILPQYRSYLTSHIRSGDPNKLRDPGTIEWPKVGNGPVFSNVFNVGDQGFSLILDQANTLEECRLYNDIYTSVTKAKGRI
jgi:carboxylesterase type B